jgi:hypothetical protein
MLMRGIGILLLIVGLLALLVGGGALGVALFIVGGIFTAMGRREISQVPAGVEVAPATETRRCPFCAETVKAEAVVCRFCNRDIDPLPTIQISVSHDDLMAKYGIRHDGSQYLFEQYRYDRLEDAVAYARKVSGA